MSLVIARELSLAHGSRVLLEADGFALGPRDRVGLVGPNGSGKSTLLKILAGTLQPDRGEVQWMRGARPGYLPQEIQDLPDVPLLDAVLAVVPGRTSLEANLAETEAQLAVATDEADHLELAQRLADLHAELDHFEDHYGRHRAQAILAGLGFKEADLARPAATLSGGWRMRAALAGLLLQDPELLLLDEPTNHLDVPTLEWFDDFLKRSNKALLLVCHDRDFLNRQIDRVLSFETEGLRTYKGDYESYRAQRAEEEAQLESRANRQAAKRAQVESFIDRFRSKATKARQVQSRIKQLEKEEIIEVREQREVVRFKFPPAPHSGREVLRLEGVSKSFADKIIYRDVDLQMMRGERVAVIGVNGAGKTTLLRLVANELAADAGKISLGHNVALGYYSQAQTDRLDTTASVLEEISRLVPSEPQSYVRSVLGSFLFHDDDVDKRISVLSGGERARVALAKLLLVPSNLLLMDEPTNHLDLDSSEALIEALQGYEGTLLFVSHNRSFVNQLATKVWNVDDGRVEDYPGNLDDWLHHVKLLREREKVAAADVKAASPAVRFDKEKRRAEAQARQQRSVLEKPIKAKIAELEARIAELEGAQKEREAQLADPAFFADFARARPVLDAFNAAKLELESLYARWEHQQEALAAVTA